MFAILDFTFAPLGVLANGSMYSALLPPFIQDNIALYIWSMSAATSMLGSYSYELTKNGTTPLTSFGTSTFVLTLFLAILPLALYLGL